ncbi:MAG: hypothetical protein GX587_08320 [Bacteroidales bacterium]|nr:hypothetical protein [Bacteroidales bacterium]HPD01241.1 hypothetical protein [Acetivibrio sp.]
MAKAKNKQNKDNKNIKDASGKYEFANDQLGENMENRYEGMAKKGKNSNGGKCK